MNKKNIFIWTLYDFANSIVSIVFYLHFSQWLVIDKGVSDFWYNMIFTVGSILLLLTAPILGSIADRTGRQQKYLNSITIITFFCFLGASIVTLFLSDKFFLAALFFLLANYFYQFSFVFYNALLSYIAPKENWGKVSGIGQAGNWLGQIAGLAVTLPLAGGAVYLIGEVGRAQAFLPSVIIFFILAIPMLIFFKLPKKEYVPIRINLKEEYKIQWNKFRDLISDVNMKYFLLAYFFFNDAIITVANNFPIYLQNVFEINDKTKTMILGGALITSVFGAYFSGIIADKIGLKKTLKFVLGIWVIFLPLLGIINNLNIFIGLCIIYGFIFGSIWTITRAAMTALTPKEKLNYGFSFYTLAERVSTFIGPLSWGLITLLLASLGAVRYRVAMIVMAIFIAIGLYLIKKVKISEHKENELRASLTR